MKRFYKFMATGFGSGLLPLAPGTWGAALALLLIYPLSYLSLAPSVLNLILCLFIVIFTWIGVKACDALEDEWGKDPKRVVIDEMIGVWIAVLGYPLSIFNLLAGFILFRFFDIAKPLGIRQLENIKGGWGVMLDDVAAGVYANIALQIIYFIGVLVMKNCC
jgi:phosphatidylglycerophosphatase A